MKKKWVALGLVFAMSTSLFSGCAKDASSSAPDSNTSLVQTDTQKAGGNSSGEKVKITYLSRYVNPELVRAGYYIDKLEEFKAQNPDIEIEDISIGDDSEAFKAKINAGVASGDLPDLFIALKASESSPIEISSISISGFWALNSSSLSM